MVLGRRSDNTGRYGGQTAAILLGIAFCMQTGNKRPV